MATEIIERGEFDEEIGKYLVGTEWEGFKTCISNENKRQSTELGTGLYRKSLINIKLPPYLCEAVFSHINSLKFLFLKWKSLRNTTIFSRRK